MLLITIRTPPMEEEERDGWGAAKIEQEGWGATEEEGTSIVMVGAVGFWGLRSMISWSFKNSLSVTLSINIIIYGAYPQLRRVDLEMLMISWRMKSNTKKCFLST
jgi:hypothetical protein